MGVAVSNARSVSLLHPAAPSVLVKSSAVLWMTIGSDFIFTIEPPVEEGETTRFRIEHVYAKKTTLIHSWDLEAPFLGGRFYPAVSFYTAGTRFTCYF